MAIKLSAIAANGGPPTLQPATPQPAPAPEPSAAAAALSLRLRFPLRPTVPLSEYADMTALERTSWEIKARSQTALYAQTMSLHGADVASLLA